MGKFVSKKPLVSKKVFESRERDEIAISGIYTFCERMSSTVPSNLKRRLSLNLEVTKTWATYNVNQSGKRRNIVTVKHIACISTPDSRSRARRGLNVIDGNELDTSVSYPYGTCPPRLTHRKTDHQSNNSRSMMTKEKHLEFVESITPTYINSRDLVTQQSSIP